MYQDIILYCYKLYLFLLYMLSHLNDKFLS